MMIYKNWIPNSSYKCTSDDFPWDYFVFTDPSDHWSLLRDYGFIEAAHIDREDIGESEKQVWSI